MIDEFLQDDDYTLNAGLIDAILATVEAGEHGRLVALLEPLHEADIADMLEQISPSERENLLILWGHKIDAGVLSELEEGIRDEVMRDLPDAFLAEAVRELDTDDVVYLVEDLDVPQQEKLLEKLDAVDRVAVEQALTYPEDSAGRLMQREFVVAPNHWTVGQAIDFMRAADDLPEVFYDVIIVDPMMHPVGDVRLGMIMGTERDVLLIDLMPDNFRTIPVEQDIEHVAYAFNQYHMVSAPVVDENGRLVGVITIDDAMEVLEDEVEEDMNLLAGLGDEDLSSRVWRTTKRRFPWLAVNLFTSVLASMVIALFAETMEQIIALAVLMPIVASMGGNAGTQALTVAVRAIATHDLTSANAMRVVKREVLVGLANGFVFAVIIGIVGVVWFGDPMLGVVLGLAMIANLLVAGLAGIMIPITLDKLGIDPALASGVFVTTVTDIVGFLAFLGLAAMLLL
ncbi:MAG: magnesium transporter [Rhodobacteraceae bacterium]|nr:magnesium transporter [Paracoccaceae bacterium]